ncbi:MAG: glycine--tRNA ligase [Candidatus Kerfeldbacteria bacterium CG08_land_8_20_14_0_20_40_16]|uniref:Glycine--tRNA ligase n=1 Tax=Candidatus Kerfeldbacteria bacterium CG08_land_8_20_14_0_20_40_16 TaxID=2014244 RepID=A0A2H0YWK3_9BACT|nr:MAG: glycine--tRNA ligase [Candidatus Kerfeldbacteria bacterium CG08_land_8_20_14_0_20_40_16]
MEKIVSLSKRRGFIFPSSEIYGGLQGFWDFGPLGVELKNNIKKSWWKKFVQERGDVVGLDSVIIMNPKVWEKSGHVKGFADKLLECKKCHHRFRGEDISAVDGMGGGCPKCDSRDYEEEKEFNLMFDTYVGPVKDSASVAYLRPETAQGIFVNFENTVNSMRLKLPFGIAQIGKAFRNEITPGNFIFRSREFEQMELEYFVNPKEDEKWFDYWVEQSYQWFLDLGIKKENIKKRSQAEKELAHYAKATVDIEYKYPFSAQGGSASGGEKGWAELVGISNRQDFDLKAHGIKYKDDVPQEEYIPYVIEPSFGVDRAALTFLLDAYEEIKGGRTTTTKSIKEEEVVLHLHKDLAPYKVAVLPLSRKENLIKVAKDVYKKMQTRFMAAYDEVASIGKRYRRQDEIGTPYCVTVDFDSLEDKAVTVRDRDTMKQERIKIIDLVDFIRERLGL